MKIAQFLYSGLGGHGSVAISLIEGDADRRWSNLLGFVGIEPLLDDYRRRCESSGIPYAFFQAKRGRPWSTWPAIRDWLNSMEPDAIICHGGPAVPPSVLYAHRRQVPLIVVEHTSIGARGLAEMLYTWIGMRLADSVVVLTEEFANGLRSSLGRMYRPEKVAVIPTGVNTERFHPGAQPYSFGSSIRIGMAGRLTAIKRQDFLISVASELHRLRTDVQWTLSIAGDGEERARLETLANDLAPDAVQFTGTLHEQALSKWYRSLDVYVHASESEALSTAILQAMASELPIVASDVPGIAALLLDDTGILLDSVDPGVWAREIIRLIASKERMRALGRRGREICLREFSSVRMFEAYDALIRSHVRR
jgi:glycosyltransferase involved in cell wall biosynthesis